MQIRWKRRRTHKEGNIKKAHLGIRMSRVNAIRFSQRFTEAKEKSNSARRKKKDCPSRQLTDIRLNLWHVSLSLELLMYYTCFPNSNVMTSNGLEQEQRLSLQVYESNIYVYDEINLYEQLILHYSLSLYRKKVKFWGVFDGFQYKNATMESIFGNFVSSLERSMYYRLRLIHLICKISSQGRIAFSMMLESICQDELMQVLRDVHVEQLEMQNKTGLCYVLIWVHSNIVL